MQHFSTFDEVSEVPEQCRSEGPIPALRIKAQESPKRACLWNYYVTISSAQSFRE